MISSPVYFTYIFLSQSQSLSPSPFIPLSLYLSIFPSLSLSVSLSLSASLSLSLSLSLSISGSYLLSQTRACVTHVPGSLQIALKVIQVAFQKSWRKAVRKHFQTIQFRRVINRTSNTRAAFSPEKLALTFPFWKCVWTRLFTSLKVKTFVFLISVFLL